MDNSPRQPDPGAPNGVKLKPGPPPGIKYCYLSETSGYPAAGVNFRVDFPPGYRPMVILEDETNNTGGKKY